MYWANEHPSKAFLDVSFNTLVLFSVTTLSHHLVTRVNSVAGNERRLAINGWWNDDWMPSFDLDVEPFAEGHSNWLEYYEENDARILELTQDQMDRLNILLDGKCKNDVHEATFPEEQCRKLRELCVRVKNWRFPEQHKVVQTIELQ